MKMPKLAGGTPFFSGTSAYFFVRTKWERAVVAASSGSGSPAANAAMHGSSCASGTAIPRMAVSGHALTQAMQPTHCSAIS